MVGDKIIKVCGMRSGDNIRAVEALGVDLMGFIFFAKSPRNVVLRPDYMPSKCRKVGVFVNEREEIIAQKIVEFDLDVVQLHGCETPEFCDSIRRSGVEVFKAISVATIEDITLTAQYEGHCDILIFDTKCEGHGGSGLQFDWSILDSYEGETPFLLSGGISVESVESIRRFNHPRHIGYDINSRFECEPALKDVTLIERFICELN
ncbi:MAG: phosphoribosylanthranilate isomerase [Rikenellaceae bacterium]